MIVPFLIRGPYRSIPVSLSLFCSQQRILTCNEDTTYITSPLFPNELENESMKIVIKVKKGQEQSIYSNVRKGRNILNTKSWQQNQSPKVMNFQNGDRRRKENRTSLYELYSLCDFLNVNVFNRTTIIGGGRSSFACRCRSSSDRRRASYSSGLGSSDARVGAGGADHSLQSSRSSAGGVGDGSDR